MNESVDRGGAAAGWRGRHGLGRAGFIFGAWTLVGLFFASQIYFYFAATEKPLSVASSIGWQLTAVFFFAAATPLILWLASRYRIDRYNWRRSVAVHAFAGLVISGAWAVAHVLLDQWFMERLAALTPERTARLAFSQLDKELLVYWIVVLISHAVAYHQRYREGELRASQAQLQALKMQLHPHFLFNSLHSISALVHKDPEAADRMIARLGDFLRLTLDTSATQEVPLRQEIDFLNCYLDIERIRFQDRLTTRIDVEPHALNCRVPNLILQPLVENAIRHGVAARAGRGRVEVSAARAGDVLRLQVRDDGPGLPSAPQPRRPNGVGVGLSNTRARLEQLYGEAFSFETANDPRGGAVVTIEIPFTGAGSTAEPAGVVGAGLGRGHYATLFGK